MPDRSQFDVIKPEVRAASEYTLTHFAAEVKLDQNENPYSIPEALKRRIVDRVLARDWNRYPEFTPESTIAALARHTGWTAAGILAGNGSNELIHVVLTATLGPGRTAVIPQPTFTLYKLMARALGATVLEPRMREQDFAFDVEALVAAARDADVTIVCSPNNPTGGLLELGEVERLCAAARGLVIVDEAYHEFSGQTVAPLLDRVENLVVLRTFSKAKMLAGLRFGYMMTRPAIAAEMRKVKLPYSVNIFTLTAAEMALEEAAGLEESVRTLVAERERVYGELGRRADVEVFPSRANFLLIRTRHPARRLFDALYREGVLVRDVSGYPMLERVLRVSTGAPAENDRFLAALDRALESLS